MPRTVGLTLTLVGFTLGCGVVVQGDELGDQDPVGEDLLEYEQLVDALESEREQALAETAITVDGAGVWLAWIDGSTLGLRRYPDRLELELPAPSSDYQIGTDMVVTVEPAGADLLVRGYALPSGELLDQQPLGFAEAELALLDETVWIIGGGDVWRWQLGIEPPVELGSLVAAGIDAATVVELEAVELDSGATLLIHADTRLWSLDLASFTAAPIAELDELLAVGLRGALFTHEDGLYLAELEGETTRIDEAITASGWSLNPTFASIHEYAAEGATLADDAVYYITSAGLFAYALDELGPAAITPILLEPRWDVAAGIPRIEYRAPLVASDRVFVRGLTDWSGDVGETGPIYATPI